MTIEEIHDGDRIPALEQIGEQAVEFAEQPAVSVTCPCGNTVSVTNGYQCVYCEIWFCKPCAHDHFDAGE